MEPDTITLTEEHFEELQSGGAELRLRVSDWSLGKLTTGRAAALRRRLLELGFEESEVLLEGFSHEPLTWPSVVLGVLGGAAALFRWGAGSEALAVLASAAALFAVSSAARVGLVSASLLLRCADGERLSQALDACLSHGDASVQSLTWRYEPASSTRAEWSSRAVARARERAEALARSLGVSVLGVRALSEEFIVPTPAPTGGYAPAMPAARAKKGEFSIGQAFGPAPVSTECAGVRVTLSLRVGPFAQDG